MNTHEHYMKLALSEAKTAYDKGEIPVGVVVVCRDRIIARGYNLTETLNDVTAHAEMQAITSAASALAASTLLIALFMLHWSPAACAQLRLAGLRFHLWFTVLPTKKGYHKICS